MKCLKLCSLAIVLLGLSLQMSAQTLQESIEARNRGAELMSNGDIEGAIAELEKCIEISKQAGTEADENRETAELAIPGLYLQKADKILDTKDYDAALKAFEEVIAVAEKYNNQDVKKKAEKPLPDIYYAIGATAFQKNDAATALKNLDLATARDADYAKAYYVKGAIYQKQQNEAQMSENYRLAVEKADLANDKKTAKSAKDALSRYFYNQGIKAMQEKRYDAAITAFGKTIEADETFSDAYYRTASCYNVKKSWDLAVTHAEQALQYKADGEKDGIYFELGNAYLGKKDSAKACEAFKQVKSDPYVANAKYQIETVLKCK